MNTVVLKRRRREIMRNRMQAKRSLRKKNTTPISPVWGGIMDDVRKIIPHLYLCQMTFE